MHVEWESDWMVGSHVVEYGSLAYDTEPDNCFMATVVSDSGEVLVALGCIDDPRPDDIRQIEHELLAEAAAIIEERVSANIIKGEN